MHTTMTDRLADSVAKIRSDPASGITSPKVSATLTNGHARLSAGPFNWETDLGPAIGGENLAPSPTAYLLGALAGCGVVFLRDTLSPLLGITLGDVTAEASCDSDIGGLLGVEGRDPALSGIHLAIVVTSPDPTERVEAMFDTWKARCPIFLALGGSDQVDLDLVARAA